MAAARVEGRLLFKLCDIFILTLNRVVVRKPKLDSEGKTEQVLVVAFTMGHMI